MKAKDAGILSAVLAATCCIGPLLLVAVGLGAGAAFIGRYHWFFLIGGTALLTWAWTKYFLEKPICDCEHKLMHGRGSTFIALLIGSAVVIGFGALNISRYTLASGPVQVQAPTQIASGLNRVVIPMEGVTCVTCEIPVRFALKRIDGVKSVQVNATSKTVTVDYEPAKTNPEQLVAAINSTGFRATLPNK